MSWSETTLSTTASLEKIEREINELIQSSGNEYFAASINMATSAITDSVDCKGGMIEIVGKVVEAITIKDGESISISVEHSQDDDTFTQINNANVVYTQTASGSDVIIPINTIIFRFVVPTSIYDYIRFVSTSAGTNSGRLAIYTLSKWEDKISIAKAKLKNRLETHLVGRGYRDYVNYEDGEELIDIIENPETFAIASDYLTLHYIFRDLAVKEDVDSMYYAKQREYKKDYEEEFAEAVRRINYDFDQDSTVDKYKADDTPKLLL